jgi:MORN repeat
VKGCALSGLLALAALLSGSLCVKAGEWIAADKSGCKIWNPHPAAGEIARWSGACKGGFAEGRGVLEWLRGGYAYERDEGEWRAGRQAGQGSQTWPGGRYDGALSDSLPHGTGVLKLGDAQYDGMFLNGTPNGTGVLTNGPGTFAGAWREGCYNDGRTRAAFATSLKSCP